MQTQQECCNICLKNNTVLINVTETDDSDIKWSCKLRFCVPEVQWEENCYVCQSCALQLDTFCSFRNRCLESNGFFNKVKQSNLINDKTECCTSQKCICSICSSTATSKGYEEKLSYTCYLCNEVFYFKSVLIEHIKTHSTNICNICEQSFTTTTQLLLHRIQIHAEATKGENVCELCHKSFKSVLALNQHIGKVHKTSSGQSITSNISDKHINFNSKTEDKSFFTVEYSESQFYATGDESKEFDENSVNSHCHKENNEINPNVCSQSDRLDILEQKVVKPLTKCQKQSRKTAFVCEECKSVFISSKKLISHAIRTHRFDPSAIKPFKCDKCDSKFTTSSNLLQHKKYHVGKRTHICTYCGKGYITKSDLNTHEKQHLNKREYQCAGCPKTFNTNKDLRSHRLVVHTDPSLWNYVCTFCEKRFPIKSNLDQHMRRHTGEKRFGCHICEKRFVDKIVLQKHIKSHSNFRAYKCEHCAKEYKDNRVLEIHMTKIHGIGNAKIPIRVKKYFCHVCPKSYFAKNKLTRHMFSHTGEKPYVCHVCERKFTDKSYVKQHLKTAHNIFEFDDNK